MASAIGAGGFAAAVPAASAASVPAASAAASASPTATANATAGATPGPAGHAASATAGAGSTVAAVPAPRLPADERRVCPLADSPSQMECQSVLRLAGSGPNAPAFVAAAASVPGLSPASLRRAYGLTNASRDKGRGETVAIVDAYRDPNAAGNLASYRSHYKLGSCTKSSGCLRIVNQSGKSGPLPEGSAGWAVEQSLDLDMVSAICPRCRILLVEARSSSTTNLGKAEDTAVAKGARFVSNSWSGNETAGQWVYNHYFNHRGDAIVFASGDDGYGTVYPAALQYVTAVGGTTLRRTSSGSRGWSETVWGSTDPSVTGGSGSGCSPRTVKPSWQRKSVDIAAGGCPYRTENDVAAVANPSTGVSVYDTYGTHGGTWAQIGGTSAATPIITAVYALAGDPKWRSYPASYVYQHPAHFHDVTSGVDGVCPAGSYLCRGERGYDGPTGVGTPNGTYGFSHDGTDPVTLVDPGGKTAKPGAKFTMRIIGLDTRTASATLSYRATGLPAGLSVHHITKSASAQVTGTPQSTIAPGTIYHVVLTAQDGRSHRSGTTRFTITIK